MTEKHEFEDGIKEILNADDQMPNSHEPKNTYRKKESAPVPRVNLTEKSYPLWATILVRALAGIIFLILLIKYATNIAYR